MCDKQMERESSVAGGMILENLHGFDDLQEPMQLHHHQYQQGSMLQPETEIAVPLNVQYLQEQAVSFIDCNNDEKEKSWLIDDYLMNDVAGIDEHNEVSKGIGNPWQRIKWTEQMVKLLITAVSYIRQYASSVAGSGRSESSVLQKIGKWKLVSKVMVERGYHVSPQQCEDKFNNLNKSYKRLNDVLGIGISCKVVENPELLGEMDIPEKAKDDVRKILSSKQLFYEEMCSYHNSNQLYLLHDPELQRSLQLALRKKDEYETHLRQSEADDFDKQEQDAGADNPDNETEDIGRIFGLSEDSVTCLNRVNIDAEADNPLKFVGSNGKIEDHPQHGGTDLDHVSPESNDTDELQKQWMAFRSCRLRVQKLQVKAQMLKLEKQRFKWERICWKQDREMKKLRLENECLKIGNEQMEMELKFKEMSADYNLRV